MIWGLLTVGCDTIVGAQGEVELFCSWVLTWVGVETLSIEGFKGRACRSVFAADSGGVRGAGGDGGVLI